MNSLVTILDAALAADLGKRQWAVFAAVLRQTLGYRKVSDDLSSGRLSQVTGIHRNHIWQAKQELVDKGLLVSAPGKFGEVLGFAVLHEKLVGGFSAYPSPTPAVSYTHLDVYKRQRLMWVTILRSSRPRIFL